MCSYGRYQGISNVTESGIPSLAAYDPQIKERLCPKRGNKL